MPRGARVPELGSPDYPEALDQLFGGTKGVFALRLAEIRAELPEIDLDPVWAVALDAERDLESMRDGLSTRLMELFRVHGLRSCFGLLFELNRVGILLQVAQRLRRYHSRADANDLLQEVFFNIYRYPTRFDCTRDDAFRVWTATIVRNTVLKHLRSLSRSGRAEVPFEDLSEQPETGEVEPLGGVIERESEDRCRDTYVLYLHLYLQLYAKLSEREQRALHLVEVEDRSYREAAKELEIKLENLKMVIFRARRKIHRSMRRVFESSASVDALAAVVQRKGAPATALSTPPRTRRIARSRRSGTWTDSQESNPG